MEKQQETHGNLRGHLPPLSRRPDVYERQLGFDLALYDPVSRRLHMLNSTAAAIWYHITPDRTATNIEDVLAINLGKDSSDDRSSLADDVTYFIRVLRSLDLVLEKPAKPERTIDVSDVTAPIPDREISTTGTGYVRPSIKSYGLEELQERFKLDELSVTRFSDTWNPNPGAAK